MSLPDRSDAASGMERVDPPGLASPYHRARSQVVISSAVLLLWSFGIHFEGPVPVLGVDIRGSSWFPHVVGMVLAYSVVRVLIEWKQSHVARRARSASRVDLAVTLVIAAVGAGAVVRGLLPQLAVPPLSVMIPAAGLSVLGLMAGAIASNCIWGLNYVRSRAEARRLGLPRIPVAVRAQVRFGVVIAVCLLTALVLSPAFTPPLRHVWGWFVAVPVLLMVLAEMRQFLPSRTRAEQRARMRRIFDEHDARYQVGGWDLPAASDPTSLYAAAQRGDLTEIRRLLDQGADPDQSSVLGWTPLAIAVAEQHEPIALLLLERGADPNLKNLLGRTPLMLAARYGNVNLVRALLRQGAKVALDKKPSVDPDALSTAAFQGQREVVALLLQAGADPSARDRSGRIAEEYAEEAHQGEIAGILRRARHERQQESTG